MRFCSGRSELPFLSVAKRKCAHLTFRILGAVQTSIKTSKNALFPCLKIITVGFQTFLSATHMMKYLEMNLNHRLCFHFFLCTVQPESLCDLCYLFVCQPEVYKDICFSSEEQNQPEKEKKRNERSLRIVAE